MNEITLQPGNGEIDTQYNWENIIIPENSFYVIKTEEDDFWKSVENKFLFDSHDGQQVHYFGIENDALKHPVPTYYAGLFCPESHKYLACIRFMNNKKADVKEYFSPDNHAKIIETHPFNSSAANKSAEMFDMMIATAEPVAIEAQVSSVIS